MAGSASGQDEANPVRVMIGYPNEQDGPVLLAWDFPLCSRKSENLWCNLWLHNKSFVDQA